MKNWTVYLLECSDKTFYCGITNNLAKRLEAHNKAKASKYTRTRIPVKVIAFKTSLTKSQALKIEKQTKKLSKTEKPNFLSSGNIQYKK